MKKKVITKKVAKKPTTKDNKKESKPKKKTEKDPENEQEKSPSEEPKTDISSKEKETSSKPKLKPKKFAISPLISSFYDIPSSNKHEKLDLSNTKISNWDGLNQIQYITSLKLNNTLISSLKGTFKLPNLESISLQNTPLSLYPCYEECVLYAFDFSLTKINGEKCSKEKIQELKNHSLAKEIQEKIQQGYLLSQYPKHDITDINELVFDPENGFKSPVELYDKQTNQKREYEDCLDLLSKFSTLKYTKPAIISENYKLIHNLHNATNNTNNDVEAE